MTNSLTSLGLRRVRKVVIALVVIALAITVAWPTPAAAAKVKSDESGKFKVTVNYKNGKPKSVNVVGWDKDLGKVDETYYKFTLPAKLKVKIKKNGKIKTYNLPVVYLKKSSYKNWKSKEKNHAVTNSIAVSVNLNSAKYLKKIGSFSNLPSSGGYKYNFGFQWKGYGFNYSVAALGLLDNGLYIHNKKRRGGSTTLVVPKKIFGRPVGGFGFITGYKIVDLSELDSITSFPSFDGAITEVRYRGYLIKLGAGDTIRIVGYYQTVSDPKPKTLLGMPVSHVAS